MRDSFKNHILKYLDQGIHLDGRKLLDFRPVTVEPSFSKTAEGSARVCIGDNEVLVGIKMELGTPFPDTPDDGVMMVGAELIPFSNPAFESGPPSIEAIELARVVDRGIRESGAIETKKLCIEPGKKVWMVSVDIMSMNVAGNLIDISGLGAMAALKNCVFPTFEIVRDEDGKFVDIKVDHKKKSTDKLPLIREPLPVTVFKVGKHFIVDPLPQEEEAADARLTVSTTADGRLCAMQKGGNGALTPEEIDKMVGIAQNVSVQLRKAL